MGARRAEGEFSYLIPSTCGFPAIVYERDPSNEPVETRLCAGSVDQRRFETTMSSQSQSNLARLKCIRLATLCGVLLGIAFTSSTLARADDELETAVSVLTSIASRIRVISEKCRVPVDPMLEGRIAEALAPVVEFSVSDLVTQLTCGRDIEQRLHGGVCQADEDVEYLNTLATIYKISIKDLKDLVSARQDD